MLDGMMGTFNLEESRSQTDVLDGITGDFVIRKVNDHYIIYRTIFSSPFAQKMWKRFFFHLVFIKIEFIFNSILKETMMFLLLFLLLFFFQHPLRRLTT